MCAAAALASGILLLGDFGGTEGRVLATTFLLALNGALAVPAAILWDQRRLPALAVLVAALAALAATLMTVTVWWEGAGDRFGKTLATVMIFLVVSVVTAALATHPTHRLFLPSVVLGYVVAALAAAAVWAEIERSGYLRVLGALIVFDVLLFALQPLLLRVRRDLTERTFRIADSSGLASSVTVRSASLAEAVATAVREAEREGRHVRTVEVLEREVARCPDGSGHR
jgi:hypothetical protein